MKSIFKRKEAKYVLILIVFIAIILFLPNIVKTKETYVSSVETIKEVVKNWPEELNKSDYDKRILNLVHYKEPQLNNSTSTGSIATSSRPTYSDEFNVTIPNKNWPPKNVYPNGGALLPFNRILAYYGNFYSTRMGILGEYDKDEVIRKLFEEKRNWENADPNTPVIPAIQYIAMVAQGSAGEDGMYRNVMPDSEIEKAYDMAKEIEGILFLDIQVGLSNVQRELPQFEKFLKRPEVHFAIDPEFSMKSGDKPGTVIGSFNANDINYTINWMSEIVKENQLPPKILIVHRFTDAMVKNFEQINPTPEVQVVINMDGWGPRSLKNGTYNRVIIPEPVQFTGVKIFYKNDLKEPSTGLWTPQEVLNLNPKPIYVQYQ